MSPVNVSCPCKYNFKSKFDGPNPIVTESYTFDNEIRRPHNKNHVTRVQYTLCTPVLFLFFFTGRQFIYRNIISHNVTLLLLYNTHALDGYLWLGGTHKVEQDCSSDTNARAEILKILRTSVAHEYNGYWLTNGNCCSFKCLMCKLTFLLSRRSTRVTRVLWLHIHDFIRIIVEYRFLFFFVSLLFLNTKWERFGNVGDEWNRLR